MTEEKDEEIVTNLSEVSLTGSTPKQVVNLISIDPKIHSASKYIFTDITGDNRREKDRCTNIIKTSAGTTGQGIIPPEKIIIRYSANEFSEILEEISQKSKISIENSIKNCKWDQTSDLTQFWDRLYMLNRRATPNASGDTLKCLTNRNFRQKMPSHIAQNVNFRTAEDSKLIEIALELQELRKNAQVDTNLFKKTRNF